LRIVLAQQSGSARRLTALDDSVFVRIQAEALALAESR